MHFIAFTCKEWKPNSLGRYGINSAASKTCFVTTMFAHMLRLIIQNCFHLLLNYLSINSKFIDWCSLCSAVCWCRLHLCCLRRWIQVGVLAPEDFSVSNLPLRGLTIRRSCVCCSVCMRNGLRFTDSKHCFADDEKTALHECFGRFGHWWEFEIPFSRMLPRNKNAPWRQLLYDVMTDTIGYVQVKMRAASLQLARIHTRFTHCARRDYKLTSLGASPREE